MNSSPLSNKITYRIIKTCALILAVLVWLAIIAVPAV
jgi:hypothetical protein